MFDRRNFLRAGAALAGGGLMRAKAAPEKPRYLRMGYLLPTESQLGAGASAMADEVRRRSDGRIQIQAFPDAALGGEVEMLKGVQLGVIDLAFITGAPLPNILPEAGVFNIPFLFNNLAHAHAVLDGPIGASYLKLLSGRNLVALAWGENGMRHITNSRRPITSPEDLRGLKLRVPQSPVMSLGFKALGAEVMLLPFPQVYAALEAGVADGQENPIATIRAAKFAQVQKFLTLSGHVYDPAVVVMSPDAHDELSGTDREILLAAARTAARVSRAYAAEAETAGVAQLKSMGMRVQATIDRPRFVAAMNSVAPDYEKMFGSPLIDQIRGDA